MAEAALDLGQLAPGEEDDLLDFGLFPEQDLATAAEVDAVDADEFDFQLDGADNLDAESTTQPDIYHLDPHNTEAVEKDMAESEIGYEDEETGLDHSDQVTSRHMDTETMGGPEEQEEINYEGESNAMLHDTPLAPPHLDESTHLEQPTDQGHHTPDSEDEDRTGDLGFDTTLVGASEANEDGYENFQVRNDAALSPEPAETGQETDHGYDQPLSTEEGGPQERTEGESAEEGQLASCPVDVIVVYNKAEYRLCAQLKDDDPDHYFDQDTYFFAGDAKLDYPLSRFLPCLREVIAEEITPEHEVLVRIDELQLEFGEVSRLDTPAYVDGSNLAQKSSQNFLNHTTFRDILDLYGRLQHNDGVTEHTGPVVELLTRLDCAHRFSELLDAANEGTGLAQLQDGSNQSEFSGSASPVHEEADYEDTYDAPTDEAGELQPREPDAETMEEEYLLGYDAPEVEPGFAEDIQTTDAGMIDMGMTGDVASPVVELASNLQENVDQAEPGHPEDYLEGNAEEPDALQDEAQDEVQGEEQDEAQDDIEIEIQDEIPEEIENEIEDEIEDEIDYREVEETNVDATQNDNAAAHEEQDITGEENNSPYANTSTDEGLGYDNWAPPDNPEEPLHRVAADEVDTRSNGAEDATKSATDHAKEDGEADEFGDEVGADQVEAASASMPTGNDYPFTFPLEHQYRVRMPQYQWSVGEDLIDYFDDDEPEFHSTTHERPTPQSPQLQVDDGLIDYSDDEEPGDPSVWHGHPTPQTPHAQVDDLLDYSDDEEPESQSHNSVHSTPPIPLPQSTSLGTAVGADDNPTEGCEESMNVLSYAQGVPFEAFGAAGTMLDAIPGIAQVHISPRKTGKALAPVYSASQASLVTNRSRSDDHIIQEHSSTKPLPVMDEEPETSPSKLHSHTRSQGDESTLLVKSIVSSPHISLDRERFIMPTLSRHGSPFTISPAIYADWPYFKAFTDSTAQPDSGLGITRESTHESEDEQIVHGSDGQIEGSKHRGTTPPNLSIAATPSNVTQATLESPTSTIKGDEIHYEDNQDAGDDFDVNLQEDPAASSGQNADEIDWDNDGDEDNISGIEEQDPNKLTPSSGSAKRSRQFDDPDGLADESG